MQRTETPHAPSPLVPLTFCARRFSISELEMIREVTGECGALSRTEISRTLCELLDWRRPNGKLKNHECRLLLERLRDQGFVNLPALQSFRGRGPRRVRLTSRSDPQPEITGSAGDFQPLHLSVVGAENAEELRLWAEYVERYHYLRHRVPVGGQPPLLGALAALPRSGVGLPVMVFSRLEDGRTRSLDWMDRPAAGAQPSLHRQ